MGGTYDGDWSMDEENRFERDSDRDGQNFNEIEPGDGRAGRSAEQEE